MSMRFYSGWSQSKLQLRVTRMQGRATFVYRVMSMSPVTVRGSCAALDKSRIFYVLKGSTLFISYAALLSLAA